MKQQSKRVAVVGAGIVGKLCAFQLMRRGHQVTVFERHSLCHSGQASWHAAGILAPISESILTRKNLVLEGQRSIELWREIACELGIPDALRHLGTVFAAHKADRHLADEAWDTLNRLKLAEHSEPAARQLFGTSCVNIPFQVRNEFHLDVRRMHGALEKILRRSCQIFENTEVLFEEFGVMVKGQALPFDQIFDTRGLGAAHRTMGLYGVRGELVRLRQPEVALDRMVRLLHPRYPIYIVPLAERGEFVVGATSVESEDCGPMRLRSALELLTAIYCFDEAFAEASILELSAAVRPTLPSALPEVLQTGNIISVNGMYRHGYLLGPATVEKAVRRMGE